jgi:preprotein translocase subunit YajC
MKRRYNPPITHLDPSSYDKSNNQMQERKKALEQFERGDKVHNIGMQGTFLGSDELGNAQVMFGRAVIKVNPLNLKKA